jgi:hypothetical protein
MEADALVAAALSGIPRAKVAALIDLTSGMFVAVEPAPDDTSTLDLFAATVKEMYDGDLTQGLRVPASDLSTSGELDGNQSVRVIVVAGDEALRVLVRMQAQPSLVLAVICPANANLGLSLAKARHLAMTHEVEGV